MSTKIMQSLGSESESEDTSNWMDSIESDSDNDTNVQHENSRQIKMTKENMPKIKIDVKKIIKVKKAVVRADKVFDGIKYYCKQDKARDQGGDLLFKYGFEFFSTCNNVDEFIKIMEDSKNPQFYEVCNKYTKLMADLEDYDCTDYEMIVKFKKFLKDMFGRVGLKFKSKYCKFIVDSSEDKRSMHFTYNSGLCFENNGQNTEESSKYSQWEFWEFVKNIIFNEYDDDNKELKYKEFVIYKKRKLSSGGHKIVELSNIDFNVYTKNHPMRCMHSYKDENKGRTFYPIKIDDEKKSITLLKKTKKTTKYLINDYTDEPKFYKLDIKLPEIKYKYKHCNIEEVKEIILDVMGDVEITEIKGNLIILGNLAQRKCVISGEIHENNNAYVVMRPKDGLYFYCHSDKCDPCDFESEYESDGLGGVCIYKFPKSTKTILDKINRQNRQNNKQDGDNNEVVKKVEEIVYDDISRMLKHMETEECKMDVKGKVKQIDGIVLTQESREIVTDWAHETIRYVNDSGVESLYVKSRIYDHKLKSETVEWVKRTPMHIFKNKDFLSLNCAQFSPKMTFKTLGPLIEYFVHTQQIDRYDKVTCIPYFDKKPKLRYTLNIFNEFYLKKEMRERNEWDDVDVNLFKNSWTYKHYKENICAAGKDLFEYHMKFLGHSIQKPDEKPEVCLVFYGKGGVGKDIHSKFHANVMGANLFHAYKSLDELNSTFNILNKNKIFIVVDEVDDKASKKNHNDFKHFLVMDFEKIEPKGIDPDYFPCYKRVIANTNFRDSWRVEHDCRRLVMYDIGRGLLGNKEWINHLVSEMRDINILKSAFKFYATMDLSDFNPRHFPVTDYKKQQASMNIKSSFQFLNHLTELDELRSELSKDLYKFCVDKDDIKKKKKDEKEEPIPDAMSDDESDSDDDDDDTEKKRKSRQAKLEAKWKTDPNYPQTSVHSYDFKIKDMYNIYKKFCEDFSLNMCKPPAFKQDMLQMGCCPMNNNKLKKFRSKAYNNKPITGFKIINEDLKKKLVDELGMELDAYKF